MQKLHYEIKLLKPAVLKITTLHKTFILALSVVVISCHGQIKPSTPENFNISSNVPPVVQRSGPAAKNPGFDSTLVSQYIRSIFQDSKGNLWFGTIEEGVVRYDTKTLTYFSTPGGTKATTVHSITEDNKGNIWLGTEDQGVYKYDGKQFRNYNE
ncbi:MAG TPA: two-component regulator propeller domain-containing protein [Bacteroidales bacterium]|nr:two-component regulator propeller domain-containing protein [Bacteroidales bacterium]